MSAPAAVERDPDGGPLFGVTFRYGNERHLDPDPSCCVRSLQDIYNVLLRVAGSKTE